MLFLTQDDKYRFLWTYPWRELGLLLLFCFLDFFKTPQQSYFHIKFSTEIVRTFGMFFNVPLTLSASTLGWTDCTNILFLFNSFYKSGYSGFSSVQSLSRVRLFATPWITARQASLSIPISWSSPKLMSIVSVMPSSHLILCNPLLFLPPIPPSIRIFSNESTLHMRWPKYWSFSFHGAAESDTTERLN